MNIAGIIAEYDPFHNGHAWQIAEARRRGANHVFVAMSSGATQRGSLPLLPEAVRARAALLAGADAVLELPAPFACTGAEAFASAGVAVLAAAGCDTLVCGAENADAAVIDAAAQILLSESYRAALKEQLAGGARNFAKARAAAFALTAAGRLSLPDDLLDGPNNNLCIEYRKAILQQKTGISMCVLPRVGPGHGDSETFCVEKTQIASASRLRALWGEGGAKAVAPFVTANAGALYAQAEREGLACDRHAFDIALLSLLRAKAADAQAGRPSPFAAVRGVSEGLDRALEKAVRTSLTAEALCDALTTVRYPRARMRRMALDAALGYTDALPALPPYLHILGARRAALPLLAKAALPADTSLARLSAASPACAACAAAQARAADLAALCRAVPGSMGLAFSTPCVLL
jgi:predicted nucleotidyltransferase